VLRFIANQVQRRDFLIAGAGLGATLTACGGSNDRGGYRLRPLAANSTTFQPTLGSTEKANEFINAWGIAIRPAGAGGHFWVTAGGWSYQFVGDVTQSADASLRTLFQDALTLVRLPGAGVPEGETEVTNTEKFIGFGTGVVFNGAALESSQVRVAGQRVLVDGTEQVLEGSARFIFATDSGVISGWTERNAASGADAVVRRNGAAVEVVNRGAQGQAYFGLAIKPGTWDRLWVADFGTAPRIRAFDAQWQPVDLGSAFANPFTNNKPAAQPGDYAPFNVQVLDWRGTGHVFVAYAKSQPDPNDASAFFAGEEHAIAAANETLRPDRGRVAMFDLDGRLVKTFADDGRLNAPWGLVVAPSNFGPLSSAVFDAMQHLWRRAFAPVASLQILAMPLGIAAVCA
jgi:uncharacterized protein (TIGR03118 family)